MPLDALWTWLSTPPPTSEVLDPFGVVYLLIFGAGFLAAAYASGDGADRMTTDPAKAAGLRHWATVGLWVFGLGLLFFGVRALQINPLTFAAPIWMVVCVIALIVAGLRCLRWWQKEFSNDVSLEKRDAARLHGAAPTDLDQRSSIGSRHPSIGP
jgi:hypothetical protein